MSQRVSPPTGFKKPGGNLEASWEFVLSLINVVVPSVNDETATSILPFFDLSTYPPSMDIGYAIKNIFAGYIQI